MSALPSPLKSPDRKSTRLNSSHGSISYAVFCLKKKRIDPGRDLGTPVVAQHRVCAGRTCAAAQSLPPRDSRQRPCPSSRAPLLSSFFFLLRGAPRESTLFPSPTLSE